MNNTYGICKCVYILCSLPEDNGLDCVISYVIFLANCKHS